MDHDFGGERPWRVGIIGTGFTARSLINLIRMMPDLTVTRVLTRRPIDRVTGIASDVMLTNHIAELIEQSDVVVECSGDVVHAAEVVRDAMAAGRPVVTMNSEFHVTCGSHFVDKGYLTEAEGDQPGATAALHRDVVGMGFTPLVYGNMKGFLSLDPSPEDMEHWAKRQDFSVAMTTSFTDGTKVQVEQALIANMYGADIVKTGLLAPEDSDFEKAALSLAHAAERHGQPISDFVVSAGQVPGVFIVATHADHQKMILRNLKMGDGPHYILVRPYHLCAMEIPKTLRAVRAGAPPLLNNSTSPRIGVAAIAKRAIPAGHIIDHGIGSFLLRGQAVRLADAPHHVPIGLIQNATVTRAIEPGQMLLLDDVDLPDSLGRDLALSLVSAG
ncbi:MAG: SAF domain-containing protein [Pseudomonadota bacterium]